MPPFTEVEVATHSCFVSGTALSGLILDPEVIAGGVETLRVNLVPALAKHFRRLNWALPQHVVSQYRAAVPPLSNVEIVPLAWPRTHWRKWSTAIERRIRAVSEESLWNYFISEHQPDFLLSTCVFNQPPPHASVPVFGIVCDVNPALSKTTLRNMAGWLESGATIFAISEFTRNELIRLTRASARQIVTLPLAANPTAVAAHFQANTPMRFLCPATAIAHKNHHVILQAALALAKCGLDFEIVLTGPGTEIFSGSRPFPDPVLESARRVLVENRCVSNRVFCRGHLAACELDAEFSRASAVLLASSYEGFGLPLAEALSRGLPVICSDIPPYQEQLEIYESHDRALLFPSNDFATLVKRMESFIQAPLPRLPESEVRKRMLRWTWDDAAGRCAATITKRVSENRDSRD
jgi:glycosyltransferase involved in cell wall biosynthesis